MLIINHKEYYYMAFMNWNPQILWPYKNWVLAKVKKIPKFILDFYNNNYWVIKDWEITLYEPL